MGRGSVSLEGLHVPICNTLSSDDPPKPKEHEDCRVFFLGWMDCVTLIGCEMTDAGIFTKPKQNKEK